MDISLFLGVIRPAVMRHLTSRSFDAKYTEIGLLSYSYSYVPNFFKFNLVDCCGFVHIFNLNIVHTFTFL